MSGPQAAAKTPSEATGDQPPKLVSMLPLVVGTLPLPKLQEIAAVETEHRLPMLYRMSAMNSPPWLKKPCCLDVAAGSGSLCEHTEIVGKRNLVGCGGVPQTMLLTEGALVTAGTAAASSNVEGTAVERYRSTGIGDCRTCGAEPTQTEVWRQRALATNVVAAACAGFGVAGSSCCGAETESLCAGNCAARGGLSKQTASLVETMASTACTGLGFAGSNCFGIQSEDGDSRRSVA